MTVDRERLAAWAAEERSAMKIEQGIPDTLTLETPVVRALLADLDRLADALAEFGQAVLPFVSAAIIGGQLTEEQTKRLDHAAGEAHAVLAEYDGRARC